MNSLASVSCGYDANGNSQTEVNSSGTTTFAWDFENRLTSVTLPGGGGTVTFKYDPFGRRIYKSSSSGTSVYAYDGDNLIEETNSGGTAVARYAQGLSIDEPLVELRSGTTSYYEADGLGSVTTLSNTAGAVAANYTYDSFGNLVASSGSIVNNFRYTGREWDPETSLYYYRARYYDPQAGRFVSEDPIRFLSGINGYRYTYNRPTQFKDWSGNDPLAGTVVGLIAGSIQGGLGAAHAGGSATDVIVAATIGGVIGAGIGAIDPTPGIGTLALIGGGSGFLGDLLGQSIAGGGTKCKPFNWGSAAGAGLGGAFSAVAGYPFLQEMGEGFGGQAVSAVMGFGGFLFPAVGADLGKRGIPPGCGCQAGVP